MNGEIMENGKKAGVLKWEKQGLYTAFSAICTFDGSDARRILLEGEDKTADLGICVPRGDHWEIATCRATRWLPRMPWRISAVPAEAEEAPIAFENLPFARLENGRVTVTPPTLR